MAGASRGSQEPRGRRGSSGAASDLERYVSRGSNRAFVVVALFLAIAAIFFVRLFARACNTTPQAAI